MYAKILVKPYLLNYKQFKFTLEKTGENRMRDKTLLPSRPIFFYQFFYFIL